MKSFFIWLIATIIGAMSGFALSYLTGFNLYLLVVAGIILGSSAGMTINIHRERNEEIPSDDLPQTSDTESKSSE